MVQRQRPQPRNNQPVPKKDEISDEKLKDELKGVARMLWQVNAGMYISAPALGINEASGVPSTEFFNRRIEDSRNALLTIGKKAGLNGTDEEIIKAAMLRDDAVVDRGAINAAAGRRGAQFAKNNNMPEDYGTKVVLKQVELSARPRGNTLVISQMEVIDMTRLISMDMRTANTDSLRAVPGRRPLAERTMEFYRDVYKTAAKGGDIKEIYARKKIELLKRLEESQRRIESKGGRIPDADKIDFAPYKTPRTRLEGRERVPVNDRDGKPIMEFNADRAILLSQAVPSFGTGTAVAMGDEELGPDGLPLNPNAPGAGTTTVTLPRDAIARLNQEKEKAGELLASDTGTAMPAARDSERLRDMDAAKPADPRNIV